MARGAVAGAIAASQIDSLLEEAHQKVVQKMPELSMNDTGADFQEQFAQSRRNAKQQAQLVEKVQAQQRLDMAKAFAVRQGQSVGVPGKIKAPARIRNRI